MAAFDKAKEACVAYYDDPNWSRFVWGRHLFEEERKAFGDDPWPHGVNKNRANLERFIGYSLDQGLMEKKLNVESFSLCDLEQLKRSRMHPRVSAQLVERETDLG